MRGRFEVKIGRCMSCPRDSETQPVAVYPNGVVMCEKHDDGVRANHRNIVHDHPLGRENG